MNNDFRYNILRARETGELILPNGELEQNTLYTGGRNTNFLAVGSSGSGKTFGWVIPMISSGAGGASMVISDTKGMLYEQLKDRLEDMGYSVIMLDFVDPARSANSFNPIEHLNSTNDVMKLSNMIVYLMRDRDECNRLFTELEVMLLNIALGYFMENGRGFERNISGLIRFLNLFDAEALEQKKPCDISRVMDRHKERYKERTGKDSRAFEQYKKFLKLSKDAIRNVLFYAFSDLNSLDTPELHEMLSHSDFDILSLAEEKTAVFINVSDTDRSKDTAINLFYSQAMDRLCRHADSLPEKRLPVPVRFILDDFGTSAKIAGFENMISNIRSRGISVMLMLQSIAQLEQGYGKGARTILSNCSSKVYLGGSDPDTARYFSELVNKPMDRVLNMPLLTHWLVRQGEEPVFGRTVLMSEYETDRPKSVRLL